METLSESVVLRERRSSGGLETGVTIIIPAYNEEAGVEYVLDGLSQLLGNCPFPHEVVVVDDGSEDGTAAAARQYSCARLLQHRSNRGYGAALMTGIRHASYDIICTLDADGTYPVERILQLVDRLCRGGYDMVVGARTGDQAAVPLIRRPAKWALGKLANLVAGESIPDINSGLRVFRRSVALRFFNLLPAGFSFTTTITLAMLTNGYLVDFLPIEYHPRLGKSKIKPVRTVLSFIQLILRISLYFAPLKIFVPLSGLLLVFAVAWGAFSDIVLGRLADVSTLVIAMTAVQVAVFGLLAELVNRRLPNYHRVEDEDQCLPSTKGRE